MHETPTENTWLGIKVPFHAFRRVRIPLAVDMSAPRQVFATTAARWQRTMSWKSPSTHSLNKRRWSVAFGQRVHGWMLSLPFLLCGLTPLGWLLLDQGGQLVLKAQIWLLLRVRWGGKSKSGDQLRNQCMCPTCSHFDYLIHSFKFSRWWDSVKQCCPPWSYRMQKSSWPPLPITSATLNRAFHHCSNVFSLPWNFK